MVCLSSLGYSELAKGIFLRGGLGLHTMGHPALVKGVLIKGWPGPLLVVTLSWLREFSCRCILYCVSPGQPELEQGIFLQGGLAPHHLW